MYFSDLLTYAIAIPHFDASRQEDVRLQPPWLVVEAAFECELLVPSRTQLQLLLDLIPVGKVLVGSCSARRIDGLDVQDKRVEADELIMTVQQIERKEARDIRRERGDFGVVALLHHVVDGAGSTYGEKFAV